MASGPLVFIHPVIETASNTHLSGPTESEGLVLRYDDGFYWNSSTTSNQLKQQEISCSTCDLSANHLLSTDWNNSLCDHSDLNLPQKSSCCHRTDLTFNNCMCNSVNSSSIVGPTPCSPTPPFSDSITMTPSDNWTQPWQSGQVKQGFNNADFFNSNSFFADLNSTATTIVNNRYGFFPPPTSSTQLATDPFKSDQFTRQVTEKTQVEVDLPTSTAYPSGDDGSSTATSAQAKIFSKRSGAVTSHNRHPSAAECVGKLLHPSSDTNVISLTDNPGTSMLKTDSTFSLETNAQTRTCCFCWCCCCSCSCVRVKPPIDTTKRSTHDVNDPSHKDSQILESQTAYEGFLSWSESFDNLMKCFSSPDGEVGQKAFREFLRSEYSEENILFWMACEDLKQETDPEAVQQKARFIYEEYISILSLREVSLDSRVRETINTNMTRPTPHTFDEAQLQIYTLMQRDSYPRFLSSRIYKELFAVTKSD